ncbi:N-acetylmuramoyl-L-alanine amidase, partial [Candidatus Pelagibacter sp.]|nr:N-acetylmuramoyl-L-alanine amidase [Candidatus Pelagibacter sp.]
MKNVFNYSPNFDSNKRKSKQIKFLIFHYTGMIKESDAISRLTNIQSEVSSHYLIQRNGTINVMVPDLYVAWHAGKSSWKGFKSLNKNSIGIEISNPGHEHNYLNFSKKQVQSIIHLSRSLLKKYKIKSSNVLG